MDRNSIIGYSLIAFVLAFFLMFNQPSQEELDQKEKAIKEQKDKENKTQETATKGGVKKIGNDTIAKSKEAVNPQPKPLLKANFYTLENDKMRLQFSTKGGIVSAVYLKEFESYDNYAEKLRNGKNPKDENIIPLELFKNGDAINQLQLPVDGRTLKTGDKFFTLKEKTADRIVFSLDLGRNRSIEQVYQLKNSAYDIDYTINLKGIGNLSPNSVIFNWETAFRRTERLLSEQRRVSTICFYNEEEGIDYLSEMGDDEADAETSIDWIAHKQSYFSSFIRPEKPFTQEGSAFEVREFAEGSNSADSLIKLFSSNAGINITDANNASIRMNWYFGPNDYETLRAYGENYDDILNFGWGLFRWINLYAVQPLFNFLVSNGIGIGWAILLLTLIIKFILMPVQWKMFSSSAKMRILKPEIDEINKKYPAKEDAMKRQMETMSLYRISGASPFAGCLPMLIQMPILLAVFRFFPAAFELRQKPFLWAEDLSSYDSIWDFGFNVWAYGDHVSLFTLLMAATTLVFTYLNSNNMQQPQQPGMPNMKVIMYIFPVLMIFFFNNYSSGLSYYYFISTLMSIIIMLMIKHFFVDEEKIRAKMAEKKAAASDPSKAKKKSKFQERLEMMQKMQQEQMKNRKK
jgi:YidC/Oxa1 family membrane protein insertase